MSLSVIILLVPLGRPGNRQVKSTDSSFQHIWVCMPTGSCLYSLEHFRYDTDGPRLKMFQLVIFNFFFFFLLYNGAKTRSVQ